MIMYSIEISECTEVLRISEAGFC